MLKLFKPKINEFITFPNHVIIWVKSGTGLIQVDFRNYTEFKDKLIFLEPKQPIKFLFGKFETAIVDFPDDLIAKSPDFRVLFKHLIAMSYIEFSNKKQSILNALFAENPLKVLDVSSNQWYWQNPFNATKEEYTIIFDLKEVIDNHFKENWSVQQFIDNIHNENYSIQQLVKDRLGFTVKNLAQQKVLIESKKDIALTDKPIQEVAYDMGFKDPAYFHRFFKQQTQLTPIAFRKKFGVDPSDFFLQDLSTLIKEHHKYEHNTTFYADRMFLSIKTLSRKIKDQLNITVGDLIRAEIINSGKTLLKTSNIRVTARELGFREPNHFSSFFKKYTGLTPSEYQKQL